MSEIFGTDGADTLFGTAADDDIYARGGNDRVEGLAGSDDIEAGSGDDTVLGGPGVDDIYGGGGADSLSGGDGADDIEGGAGDDTLIGGAGNDDLYGQSGSDRLEGGPGDDELTGGSGPDLFVFTEGFDEIEDFRPGEDTVLIGPGLGVSDFAGLLARAEPRDGGEDTVIVLEGGRLLLEDVRIGELAADSFLFSDPGTPPGGGSPADLAVAREVALLYEAVLDRDGAIDTGGLNFWIDRREAGATAEDLAATFLASPEFAALAGPPEALSDRALVELLYRNILERDGEGAGIDFWTGQLANPGFDRPDLLLAFANSAENVAGAPFLDTLVEVAPGEWGFA